MKVLWINHRDIKHPKAGGAERTIYEVGKRLVGKGMELYLLSVNPGNLDEKEEIDGIHIIRIEGNIKIHLLLRSYIKKLNPDVIIDDLAHGVPWLSPWFTKKKVIVFYIYMR